MKKELSLMLVSMKLRKAYLFDFIIDIAIFPVYAFITYFLWSTLIANGFQINLLDIFTYYCLMFIVGEVFFSADPSGVISQDVIRGTIAYRLVRPISYVSYLFWRRAGRTVLKTLVNLLFLILIIFLLGLKITWELTTITAFMFSLIIGFVLMFFVYFMIGLSALWIEENWGLKWAFRTFERFLAGTWIPLYLLPASVQGVIGFLPFKYTGYFQVMLLQGKIPLQSLSYEFLLMAVWIIVLLSLSKIAWKIGRKRIEGHGV